MSRRQILPDSLWRVFYRHPVFFWSGFRFLSATFLLGLAVSLFPSRLFAQPDLLVLRSDASGVTFDYTPAPAHRDTVFADGAFFDVLTIDHCLSTSGPGAPVLPRRHVLVGLPSDAAPTAILLEAPFREETGYRFALSAEKTAIPVSARAGFFPVTPLESVPAGKMQGQTVWPLMLSPVAYDPTTGRARFYERLRVEVRFNAPPTVSRSFVSSAPSPLGGVLESILLNGKTTRTWRADDAVSPALRVNSFGPGEWYKVRITETGLYRIDRQTLQQAGMDVNGINPRTLRLFSGGGRTLPHDVDSPRPALAEVAIRVAGEQDGRFDENDTILFYGTGVSGFEFLQAPRTYAFYDNPYTDTNVYWLSTGGSTPGLRIGDRLVSQTSGATRTDTQVRRHEEREIVNPLDSGTEWFWQLFDGAFREEAIFQVDLGKVARNGRVTARFRFQSRTRFTHHVQAFVNDHPVGDRIWAGESTPVLLVGTGDWIKDGVNEIRIVLPRTAASANQPDHVYFDWFELDYRTPLDASGGDLVFEQEIGESVPIVRYEITGAASDTETFDITNPFRVVRMATTGAFSDSSRVLPAQYRTVRPNRWKRPVSVTRDTDSDLRNSTNGADYLIIAHDDFVEVAERLRAHRAAHSNLRATVVRISDIYDEFSFGLFDPTAIRDFLRYAAFGWSGASPSFALLLGDGHYDYRNRSRSDRPMRIPPFEDGDRCTDDFFVYFDGNNDPLVENDIFPDMAIGRLPARSPQEASVMVDKIVAYEASPEFGVWRNTIVLTADDERTPGAGFDEPFHIGDTERLATRNVPGSFRVEKVYLTEYPLDAAGEKPGARVALVGHINDGAVLVNWVGHGAANLWAHERIFNTSRDLASLDNGARLPVFVTATCTAGRFDMINEEAMAEDFLRAEGKGAIGFIGATRLSFPSPNAALNRGLYDGMLGFDMTVGEALLRAKIATVNRENSEKYTLFGDPAMRLGVPSKTIRFVEQPDTLRVLRATAVSGEVLADTSADRRFSGTAFLRASDSERNITYVADSGGQIPYRLLGADMFRGPVPVFEGRFSGAFIVPRDVTYGGLQGRIAVYATDGRTDAAGVIYPLALQGADPAFRDSTGPDIDILVEGRSITDGDYVSTSPLLTVRLSDESGINITGEVGHQIILQTDADAKTRQDVTPRFQYDAGSFRNGSFQFRLSALTPGDHSVSVKAWDNFNNPSTTTVSLKVVEDTDLRITDIISYPNPCAGPTTFTFELTQDADIALQVYTVAGTPIRSFPRRPGFRGFNQVDWDGADEEGATLANGAYLYKITARSNGSKPQTVSAFGRLLVVR